MGSRKGSMEVQAPEVQPTAEETKPEAPSQEAAPQAPAEAQAPVSEQYELPDGSKVDAEGLSKAWRDNFMPEYTRKSQELAALKAKSSPAKEEVPAAELPWKKDQAWEATTYDALAEPLLAEAEKRVWEKIVAESGREERERQEREAYVAQEVEQLKGIDPKANVQAVMAHASKYQFPSLIPAYQNMRAIEDAARLAEERVLKNMKQRAGEPVGGGAADPGAGITFPADVQTGYEKALYVLRNNK